MPKEYALFESSLKKDMGQLFRRGTVDVFIQRYAQADFDVQVNLPAAKKWLQAHRELAKKLNLPINNSSMMEKVFSLPQVFEHKEKNILTTKERALLQKTFRQALKKCDLERKREGSGIQRHLHDLLKSLLKIVSEMTNLREQAKLALKDRLAVKLKVLQTEAEVDVSKLAQEVLLIIDKSDITEELERLKEHLNMCLPALQAKGDVGKKLDFYSQELLREINTIGSKANYAPLTEKVVQAKTLVEAFREQVQNVE